jgi:predicted secreted hydrolase
LGLPVKPLAFSLCILPLLAGSFPYREALPGYKYQFPRDHFEHQDFRTEWWYYTGNVTTAGGERFGFELVFFREGERTAGDGKTGKTTRPAWAVEDLYLAHAALTDAKGKRFRYEERLNRAGPGVAGASFDRRRIWNGNWSAQWTSVDRESQNQTLDAVTEHFRFHLQLTPETPFVIQGENGVSQKAEGAGRASHYVSFPRLGVSGTIDSRQVSGTAWMDHEWFTEQLAPDQVGWDWFSVQLDNHTELMLFELRSNNGSIDSYSSGTFIDARGVPRHLKREEFTLQPLSYWHKYPVSWRLRAPSLNIDLTSRAVLPDQELRLKQGGSAYWEGAVDYSGTQQGVGYLEMTGYEGAVRF